MYEHAGGIRTDSCKNAKRTRHVTKCALKIHYPFYMDVKYLILKFYDAPSIYIEIRLGGGAQM